MSKPPHIPEENAAETSAEAEAPTNSAGGGGGETSAAPKDDLAPQHAAPQAGRNAKKRRSIITLSVVLAVLVAIAAAGIGYLAWQNYELQRAAEELANQEVPEVPSTDEEETTETNEVELVENPIDFTSLKAENNDIYAWIYIPGTDINLPVLQHVSSDSYYLDHNQYGDYAVEGSIYSQSMNATDFSDPVTVLYGHNNVTRFHNLHYFEDADFFNENEFFYIYTPGHIFTYRIVSAYQYDNRHILNSFDFSDATVLQSYFDYVANPDALIANVREGTALAAATDKIVQLSTCVGSSYHDRRYIVSGVLVDDQETY